MQALPMILAIAGAASGALGAISSANSKAAALTAQSQAARYNAENARKQAEMALRTSTAQQIALRRQQRQMLGSQRAAVAQSGTGFSGSNADIMDRSETLAELDVLNLAYEGALKARGFNAQADLDEFEANVLASQAKQAKRSRNWIAITGMAQAGSQIADYQSRRSTVPVNSYGGSGGGRGITPPSGYQFGSFSNA